MNSCPCGSSQDLDACCGPLLAGGKAATPEAMMRSRYSAYVLGQCHHLEVSLTPESRRDFDLAATERWAKAVEWRGLTIVASSAVGADDRRGTVEFIAKFHQDGAEHSHHEVSRFHRLDGNWLYNDGDVLRTPMVRGTPKVGRNDPCPCGSGKKFKQCCGGGN